MKTQEQCAQEMKNRQGKSATGKSGSAFSEGRFLCILFCEAILQQPRFCMKPEEAGASAGRSYFF
jgi:hypothetical protein